MSIYLDEKNPEKHKPFDDASPDIVAYVRYLEVIAHTLLPIEPLMLKS